MKNRGTAFVRNSTEKPVRHLIRENYNFREREKEAETRSELERKASQGEAHRSFKSRRWAGRSPNESGRVQENRTAGSGVCLGEGAQ